MLRGQSGFPALNASFKPDFVTARFLCVKPAKIDIDLIFVDFSEIRNTCNFYFSWSVFVLDLTLGSCPYVVENV
jgi:hypothetical protein